MRSALIVVQLATFIGLGALLLASGHPKLGVSQLLLAATNALIYS